MSNPQAGWLAVRMLVGFLLLALAGPLPLTAGEPKGGQVVLESKGYLMPASQVLVSPRVAGHVVEMLVNEGQHVKKGEVLARLDPAMQMAAVRLAQAQVKLAEAGLAKAREANSKADLAIAQAKVEVARAQLDLAEQSLDGTVVRAPIDGVVLSKRVEAGTLVNPNGYQVHASLCELADLRILDVEVSIPEKVLTKVAVGQACLVRLEAIPGTVYRGRVARMLPVADRARGALSVRVRLEVPEGDNRLRPEFGAIVQFMSKE